jgi:dipeptidyl aminopeptidase/acylaminoacyl peptidase
MEIEGLLLYPVGYEAGRRYPTMAFIHGGPSGVWTQSFPGSWGNYGHVYAGRGWVAFYPNVRGSSAYGEKFLAANVKDWGGGDYQDIQSGLDHLVRQGIADPARMGQAGWSYGGYMTAWTLTQTDRFKAVMVGAGLTNMYSMYSTNDLQTVLEDYFGVPPWDDEAAYRRASAMTFIKKAKTPTLILHGQQDQRVPIGQAQELYMGLRKNGVPVSLVFYPREGHGLGEPRHQLDKMTREYAFFAKHVLGIEAVEPRELVP